MGSTSTIHRMGPTETSQNRKFFRIQNSSILKFGDIPIVELSHIEQSLTFGYLIIEQKIEFQKS